MEYNCPSGDHPPVGVVPPGDLGWPGGEDERGLPGSQTRRSRSKRPASEHQEGRVPLLPALQPRHLPSLHIAAGKLKL